jgi:hypothetical protein
MMTTVMKNDFNEEICHFSLKGIGVWQRNNNAKGNLKLF